MVNDDFLDSFCDKLSYLHIWHGFGGCDPWMSSDAKRIEAISLLGPTWSLAGK